MHRRARLINSEHALLAFGLTLFAGLATGIGSAIAFFAKRTNYRLLSISLAFSAGVMLYVSFVEILLKAERALSEELGPRLGGWTAVGSFFGGILLIAVIDRLVPAIENPHEVRTAGEVDDMRSAADGGRGDPRLMRMGTLAAIAIAIHNFPEGLATFIATLNDPAVGVAVAIAVALHNIPEGLSVAVPVFYATGSRGRAFVLSFLSGLAEPAGALLGFAALGWLDSPIVMGVTFGGVAGIMVFVSLDELFPTAREYGTSHGVVYSLTAGMAVMAVSLLLLR